MFMINLALLFTAGSSLERGLAQGGNIVIKWMRPSGCFVFTPLFSLRPPVPILTNYTSLAMLYTDLPFVQSVNSLDD